MTRPGPTTDAPVPDALAPDASAPVPEPAPITHRRVLAIALPIAVSNAAVPLLGAVDTAVVGRLGAIEVGAVGLGAVVLAFLYGIFNFLRMSTTGLVAQSAGRGDAAEGGAHLLRALVLGLGIGIVLVASQGLLFRLAFGLAPASDAVEAMARDYLGIRIWGVPATIALYAIMGWLIGVERTRAVLALQLAMNGLNAGLNILFVMGFGWGVPGVAIASLIAEGFGLAFGLWLARGALMQAWADARSLRRLFARDRLARLLRVNGDIFLRSVMLQMSLVAFVFLGAAQGDRVLAANQVLVQFMEITAFALDGFAFSAEALVGQAVGARRPAMLRRAAIVATGWGVAGALVMAAVFAVFGGALIDLLTTLPELRETARHYLPWLVAFPVIGIMAWMLDGIFIGATLTGEMRRAMLISVAAYAVVLATLPGVMGNHALWLGLVVLNVMRALTMARWYPRAEAAARG